MIHKLLKPIYEAIERENLKPSQVSLLIIRAIILSIILTVFMAMIAVGNYYWIFIAMFYLVQFVVKVFKISNTPGIRPSMSAMLILFNPIMLVIVVISIITDWIKEKWQIAVKAFDDKYST